MKSQVAEPKERLPALVSVFSEQLLSSTVDFRRGFCRGTERIRGMGRVHAQDLAIDPVLRLQQERPNFPKT